MVPKSAGQKALEANRPDVRGKTSSQAWQERSANLRDRFGPAGFVRGAVKGVADLLGIDSGIEPRRSSPVGEYFGPDMAFSAVGALLGGIPKLYNVVKANRALDNAKDTVTDINRALKTDAVDDLLEAKLYPDGYVNPGRIPGGYMRMHYGRTPTLVPADKVISEIVKKEASETVSPLIVNPRHFPNEGTPALGRVFDRSKPIEGILYDSMGKADKIPSVATAKMILPTLSKEFGAADKYRFINDRMNEGYSLLDSLMEYELMIRNSGRYGEGATLAPMLLEGVREGIRLDDANSTRRGSR